MLGRRTVEQAAARVTAAAEHTKESIVAVGLVAVVALVLAVVSVVAVAISSIRTRKLAAA